MSREEAVGTCCASCGVAEIDDIKLVPCDDCDLVKYCSDECQHNHKSEHKEACKKRAAELHDELLFKQPETTHLGDCPICCVPLPLEETKSGMCYSCSKIICMGCFYANAFREEQQSCPFCREPLPGTKEESEKLRMKRVEANDPVAMCQEGVEQRKKGDFGRAFEYFTKAAELGNASANWQLAIMYRLGEGVEKDEGKEIHNLEEAAIGGHSDARFLLGAHEYIGGNYERAVKHYTITATQGYDNSIKALMNMFKEGFMEKEDLASALRAHKVAVDATKSPQRDEADKMLR